MVDNKKLKDIELHLKALVNLVIVYMSENIAPYYDKEKLHKMVYNSDLDTKD